mgnify:FL=1
MKAAFAFLLQSIVVGLAAAFLVVLVRPDLLPVARDDGPAELLSFADAVEISAPSVASVYTKRLVRDSNAPTEQTRFRISTSYASAVIIDPDGYLVTNYHGVAEAAEIRVQLSDGRIAEPEIIGWDPETDLALLKLDIGDLPAVRFGSSANLRIGDVVLAIGTPYGLSKSVTQGIVSATGRSGLNLVTFENFIQTDAAINAGNSGGALVNTRGELVGINTARLDEDANTEGISFAVPADLVRGVVDQIKQHGRVIRGWMGMVPDDLTDSERDLRGLEPNVGIIVLSVHEGGPAAIAGLRSDDVILSMNGEVIADKRQALLISASTNPGDPVELVILRDGERQTVTLAAAERPEIP